MPGVMARHWLFLFFIILQLGDGYSTYFFGKNTSLFSGVEANPLLKMLFESVGFLPGLIFAKSVAVLLGFALHLSAIKKVRIKKIFKILIVVYLFVNLNNFIIIYSFFYR